MMVSTDNMAIVILESITPNAEDLIERACRTCYLSFHRYDPPNSAAELIQKVIKKKHHSVLEHAGATFRIKGGSRVFTHEMVRHRLSSPSQESQRYCIYADAPGRKKTKDYLFVLPPSVCNAGTGWDTKFGSVVKICHEFYEEMIKTGVPPEDARYILPNATTSDIVITANMREWRHIFTLRGNSRAHWEIRGIAIQIFKILKERCPNVFYDMELGENGDTIEVKNA